MTAKPPIRRPTLLKLTALGATMLLAEGCATESGRRELFAETITPYRITIEQGNAITREAVAQLRPGMSQDQVRYLLGTPLLMDAFHDNRCDFVFSYRRGHRELVKQRHLTVYFDHGKLSHLAGDPMPSECELIAEMDGSEQRRR